MARYITLPITVSPVQLLQRAYTFLQNLMPSWRPAEGNLDVWLLEASTTEIQELVSILSAVPDIIFQYFGSSLIQLPRNTSASAIGYTTWFTIDDSGYTIPAGTQIALKNSTGESIPFLTVNEVGIPAGVHQTDDGAVIIQAITPGTSGNGLGGDVILLDILDYVTNAVVLEFTGDGADGETDDQYMDRLVNQLTLLTLTPVLPDDFVTLANTVSPAWRTTALDMYNPADDTFNNPRMITIAAIDQAGEAVDTATKNAIKALLQSVRETTFVVNTMDPTYTSIDVTVTVEAEENVDHVALETDVTAAINAFLQPSSWGASASKTSSSDPHNWVNTTIVRKYDLSQAIHTVSGVWTIVPPLLLGESGGTLAEDDVTLNGRVSLPRPGTIDVTVT